MRKKAKISMVAGESADEAFSRFLLTKHAGGVITKTIDTCSRHFHAISKHLDIHQEITEWTSADLQEMIVSMQKSRLSPNSIKSYSITLKAFLSWCNTEGLTSLNMAKYKGKETILIKETLNKSAAAERRAFCPIRAVPKLGNTQSIPTILVLSAEPKSLAVSSCRFNQSFLKITGEAMEITFTNPGADYMIQRIMDFQTETESAFWSEPLYHFYPQLDKAYATSLPFADRKNYIERTMRAVYAEFEDTINEKVALYTRHWIACKPQITAALSDAFGVDCANLFNDIRCYLSLNPIEPRFLKERCYDTFYLNSERGAIGGGIHEIIHFVWFYVWNRLFGDSYDEYERPSLKWILSEMVVESVMKDERLSSINPYFPRENGGCIYPYFFDMMVDGKPILDTLDAMYKSQSIEDFMLNSYAYCKEHEAAVRDHIQRSEG